MQETTHAPARRERKSLCVKTEFYQKFTPQFLRIFSLTSHNSALEAACTAPKRRNATGISKSYQHFPQTFQQSFFLYFSMAFFVFSRKCQTSKRYFTCFTPPLCGFHNPMRFRLCRRFCIFHWARPAESFYSLPVSRDSEVFPHNIIRLYILTHHEGVRADNIKSIPSVESKCFGILLPYAKPHIFFSALSGDADRLIHQILSEPLALMPSGNIYPFDLKGPSIVYIRL